MNELLSYISIDADNADQKSVSSAFQFLVYLPFQLKIKNGK